MTINLHVCTICLRPEAVYDVISGRNIKTIERYHAANFRVASSNTFRGEAAAAEADMDDSIKLKLFRISLNNTTPAIIMRLQYNHCNEK